MPKQRYYQQESIEEARDATNDYDDDHHQEFSKLLFDELLINIQHISFETTIQEDLHRQNPLHRTVESNGLFWLYEADRKRIGSKTVYTFHVNNACDWNFYRKFEIKAHHLFQKVPEQRHGSDGWYEYIGPSVNDIGPCLKIGTGVRKDIPYETKLFIHQERERTDIQFNFHSINERIAVNFRSGTPAE